MRVPVHIFYFLCTLCYCNFLRLSLSGVEHTPLRKKISVGGLAPTAAQLQQQQQGGWTHQQHQQQASFNPNINLD